MEQRKQKNNYDFLIKWFIRLGDLLVINSFFVVFYKLYPYVFDGGVLLHNVNLEVSFLLINLIYFIASSIVPNRIWSNIIFFDKVVQQSVSFISVYFVLFTVGAVLLHLAEIDWWLWLVCLLAIIFTYTLWHIFLRIFLKQYRRRGYNHKRVAIVGGGSDALNIYSELNSSDYGYQVLGFFDDVPGVLPQSKMDCLGSLAQIEKFCLENRIDELYCTLASSNEATIVRLINFAERNMIRFYLVPHFYDFIKRQMVLSTLQTILVMTIRREPLQSLSHRFVKRLFDVVFSVLVCITVFPLVFVVFGILIKLTSKGSVFFKQKRTGLQGKEFVCYKFRTMTLNREADEQTAVDGDPRVTSVGAFMRRSSIDELPQFINVLIGNMSVVGPRPHMLKQTDLYNQLIDRFMIRHLIKPGITGWAQISGYRGETKTVEQMEGRFKRDVWYIENWSFVLDLKIVVVTVIQLLKGDRRAY